MDGLLGRLRVRYRLENGHLTLFTNRLENVKGGRRQYHAIIVVFTVIETRQMVAGKRLQYNN